MTNDHVDTEETVTDHPGTDLETEYRMLQLEAVQTLERTNAFVEHLRDIRGAMRWMEGMLQRQQQTAAPPPGAGVPQGPQLSDNGLVGPDGSPLHHEEPQPAPDLPVVPGSNEVAGTGPIAEA